MTERLSSLPPERREHLKGNKLEYLYQVSHHYSHLPLLGSAIRALGKEWRVAVRFEGDKLHIFESLKASLHDPHLLQLEPSKESAQVLLLGGMTADQINKHRESNLTLGKQHVMVSGEKVDDAYDLVSHFSVDQLKPTGVTAITGTGKGKTTTALGLAVEQFVQGKKTAVVQWFKEPKSGRLTWAINEHFFPELLQQPELITFSPMGMGFFGSPTMDRVAEYQLHRDKAYQGLELAREIIRSGKYGLVVLDEFVDTVPEISQNIEVPLIDLVDVQAMLKEALQQTHTQVVVTGRQVTEAWGDWVGTSIVIDEVRHPWSTKQAGAVSGLDF